MKQSPDQIDMHKYLGTTHWRKFVARYKASDRKQTCFACGQENVVLHHRTYERLGNERLSDVVPLCNSHHIELHRRVERGEFTLYDAHKHLTKLADPRGSVSRKHPERDIRPWRTSNGYGRAGKVLPEVRHVDPEEARAMVEASRSVRRRPTMS